uniref:Uncharacterized protein n=1 Tax=Anguilla anguilla TaxID=7936 RepID=A0A0E9PXD8_ANGAN
MPMPISFKCTCKIPCRYKYLCCEFLFGLR